VIARLPGLMVYQLAYICRAAALDEFDEYDRVVKACEAAAKDEIVRER
jgi:hypothetical protein